MRMILLFLLAYAHLAGELTHQAPRPFPQEKLFSSYLEREGKYGNQSRGFHYCSGHVILFITFEKTLPSSFTPLQSSVFKCIKSSSAPVKFIYAFGLPFSEWEKTDFGPPPSPYPPRSFSKEISPKKITAKKLGEKIFRKRALFFTGAGISAAAGMHTLSTLWKECGIDFNQQVDSFTLNAIDHPELLVEHVLAFYRSGRESTPTKAHYALANIARCINAPLITGNFDLLHQKTGLTPYDIWSKDYPESISDDFLRSTDLVVCIGMSHDIRSFLARYKTIHPKGKIAALDLESPPFLGKEDYFLQGDVQTTLIELEKTVFQKTTYH